MDDKKKAELVQIKEDNKKLEIYVLMFIDKIETYIEKIRRG